MTATLVAAEEDSCPLQVPVKTPVSMPYAQAALMPSGLSAFSRPCHLVFSSSFFYRSFLLVRLQPPCHEAPVYRRRSSNAITASSDDQHKEPQWGGGTFKVGGIKRIKSPIACFSCFQQETTGCAYIRGRPLLQRRRRRYLAGHLLSAHYTPDTEAAIRAARASGSMCASWSTLWAPLLSRASRSSASLMGSR